MSLLHDILFPPRCPGCGTSVAAHGDWCPACFTSIWHPRLLNGSRRQLDGCYSLTDYRGPIRRVLQRLKFEQKLSYEAACQYLLARFPWPEELKAAQLVVPVPLSQERLRKRGYNQSEIIFRPWAETFSVWTDALQRLRETEAQWTLDKREREANLKRAFSIVYGCPVRGRHILLVDDIYTTGATMEECARALKKGGAASVKGVVIASGAV